MAWMWKILNAVGPHTEHCINMAIRDRAELFHFVEGMSPVMARGKAVGEVHQEVKQLYKSGGAEAVRHTFRCVPKDVTGS